MFKYLCSQSVDMLRRPVYKIYLGVMFAKLRTLVWNLWRVKISSAFFVNSGDLWRWLNAIVPRNYPDRGLSPMTMGAIYATIPHVMVTDVALVYHVGHNVRHLQETETAVLDYAHYSSFLLFCVLFLVIVAIISHSWSNDLRCKHWNKSDEGKKIMMKSCFLNALCINGLLWWTGGVLL